MHAWYNEGTDKNCSYKGFLTHQKNQIKVMQRIHQPNLNVMEMPHSAFLKEDDSVA